MGMYTEFVLGVSLKSDTPLKVIDALEAIVNKSEDEVRLFNHEFFYCSRYQYIATSGSYYFGYSDSTSKFYKDKLSNTYLLSIRSSIKNYENEIEKFIDCIRSYVDSGSGSKDLLGYMMYEESIVPYLFFKDKEFEQSVNNNINADQYIE